MKKDITCMKLLLIITLLIPQLVFSQAASEFQLIRWNRIIIESYNFPSGEDTLESHRSKFRLMTTNLAVNDGISEKLNDWFIQSKLKPVAINSSSRISKRSNLSFVISQAEDIKSNIILREFSNGEGCDSCQLSIFSTLLESPEIKQLLKTKLKWIHTSYFQTTFNGDWIGSYVIVYWRQRGKRQSAIFFNLD